MDDIDLALPDNVIVIVVLRLGVRPQPPDPEQELPRLERLVIYLPDREVWIASTRSSSASAGEPRAEPQEAHHDDEKGAPPVPHARTIASRGSRTT